MRSDLVPYISSAFVGPVSFAFAVNGILDKKWRFRSVIAPLLVLTIVMCLGENTPVFPSMLTLFPVISIVRFPVKLLFFVVFGLSILAARGVYLAGGHTTRSTASTTIWTLTAAFGVGLMVASRFDNPLIPSVAKCANPSLIQAQWDIGISLLASAIIAAVFSELSLSTHRLLKSAMILSVLTASLLCDAWIYTNQSTGPGYFKQGSVAEKALSRLALGQNDASNYRVTGLYLEHFTVPPNLLSPNRESATALAYQYSRQLLKPNTNIDFNVRSALGFECAPVGDYYIYS